MRNATKIALAAALASAVAAPALAGEWVYHGGPKYPLSTTWYEEGYFGYGPYGGNYGYGGLYGGYYGYGGPYGGPNGGPYGYAGDAYPGPGYGHAGYYGGPAYGRNERLYRCTGPATSDCYNSRQLAGTR
jgi:hypothetical protein